MRKILLLTCAVLALFTGCKKHQESSVEEVLEKYQNTGCEVSFKRQVYDALTMQNWHHNNNPVRLYSDIRVEMVEIKSYEEFCDAATDSINQLLIFNDLKWYGYKIKDFDQFKEKWQSYDSLVGENRYKIEMIIPSVYIDIDKVVHKTLDCPYFGYRKNKHAHKKISFAWERNLDCSEMYFCNYCLSIYNMKYIRFGKDY